GRSAILAHIDIHSPCRVSKYGIDIDSFEQVGVSALHQAVQQCDLVVIDEIGKMELFSSNFRETVLNIIGSGKKVLGTIMLNPNPWADAIKHQPQVNLVTVTRDNHHRILEEVREWLKEMGGGKA
ncbi:nucleoside-triphosphatase, partial [Chloroflexota bacterium]